MDEAGNNNEQNQTTATLAAPPTIHGNAGEIGGLVAAVEGKLAELMAWHSEQSRQLDAERAKLAEQTRRDRDEIRGQREQLAQERTAYSEQSRREREEFEGQRTRLEQDRAKLAEQAEVLDRKRVKMLELAQKLEAEQAALSREWTAVHHARELNEKLAAELDRQRTKVGERVSTWLGQSVASLEQPLRLADAKPEQESEATDPFAALESFEEDLADQPEKAKKRKAA